MEVADQLWELMIAEDQGSKSVRILFVLNQPMPAADQDGFLSTYVPEGWHIA